MFRAYLFEINDIPAGSYSLFTCLDPRQDGILWKSEH